MRHDAWSHGDGVDRRRRGARSSRTAQGTGGGRLSGSGPVEIWRGGVNPWECDEMGHLNVRFYLSRAIEGLGGLARQLGQPDAFAADARATLLVRQHHIRFLREARSGAALNMTGGVAAMGETDATLVQLLHHSGDDEPCAAFLTRVEHATSGEARPFPWPERARVAADRLRLDPPAFARPRGLAQDPPSGEATLTRAERLGLVCIGRGVVTPAACDAFGRMAVDQVMARISDGMGGFFRPFRTALSEAYGGARIGGAALEYRLRYGDLPRAGAHLELRSAVTAVEEKVSRVVHWLLDPATGRAWATAEGVVASFDLDARRVTAVPPELRERLSGLLIPAAAD